MAEVLIVILTFNGAGISKQAAFTSIIKDFISRRANGQILYALGFRGSVLWCDEIFERCSPSPTIKNHYKLIIFGLHNFYFL